jgi:hypothetical protein
MLLNRILSSFFSASLSSIFSFFAGELINFTALLFFLPAISFYNFRKTFTDERLKTLMDLITLGIWVFAFFLIFFPQTSIKYSFINFQFIELILIAAVSFLYSFSVKQKQIKIFMFFATRIFLFFLLPFNLLVFFSTNIQLILLAGYGKPIIIFILTVYIVTIIFNLLINIFKKKIKNTFNLLKNTFFPVLAFIMYFGIINPANYFQIHRFSLIIFYILIIPTFLKIYKNRENLLQIILNSEENRQVNYE